MIKNQSFNLTYLPLKLKLAISSLIIWLGAVASLIYFCPQFIPDGETLLFCDFESTPRTDLRSNQLVLEPWHHVSQGVIWEPEDGFAGSAGIKLVANPKNPPFVEWVLANPQRFPFLEFRGRMRSEKIIRGEEKWQAARFLVYFTKEGKPQWDYPHVAGSLLGTSPWKEFVKLFPVPGFAENAHVTIQNISKSGAVWCDDISLKPIQVNPSYLLYKNILIISGVILGIAMIISFGLWKRSDWIPLTTVAVIIFCVVCSNKYLEMFAGLFRVEAILLKNYGHLFLFFILGLVSTRWLGARLQARNANSLVLPYPVFIFVGLVLFACITEFFQFATIDRNPSVIDLLIDMTGIGAGTVLASFSTKQLKK